MNIVKELYAFPMPDKTTWVGKWNDTSGTIDDLVIFDTPSVKRTSPEEPIDKFVYLGKYFAKNYEAIMLKSEGDEVTRSLGIAEEFDHKKAIARIYLQPFCKKE